MDPVVRCGYRPVHLYPRRVTLLPARASLVLLVGMLAGVGTLHLVHPKPFDALVPGSLGHPRPWTYGSGVAELTGAALLAHPRTRRVGGWWAAVLLVAVFPGNVKAALDGGMRNAPAPLDTAAAAWIRLPLQIPLVAWALRHGRGLDGGTPSHR
jgi:uncharacterized membrane protein